MSAHFKIGDRVRPTDPDSDYTTGTVVPVPEWWGPEPTTGTRFAVSWDGIDVAHAMAGYQIKVMRETAIVSVSMTPSEIWLDGFDKTLDPQYPFAILADDDRDGWGFPGYSCALNLTRDQALKLSDELVAALEKHAQSAALTEAR